MRLLPSHQSNQYFKGKKAGLAYDIFITILFILSSAVLWLLVNNFNIAREDGYDPFRYEYFAREDLPEYLAESSSYTIVFLLKFIYSFLPNYIGYLALICGCFLIVLRADRENKFKLALISPIAFFYIAQTGKDGLSILALISIAIIAISPRISLRMVSLLGVIALGIFVRPALIPTIFLIFILFRYGLFRAILFSLVLSLLFAFSTDLEGTLSIVEGAAHDESSGPLAQFGRVLTYGYSIAPILGRLFLYLTSPLFQPIASVIKLSSGAEYFVIFEGLCQVAFFSIMLRRRLLIKFMRVSFPFCLIIAVMSPFYHYRYIAIIYPVIFCYVFFWPYLRGADKSN